MRKIYYSLSGDAPSLDAWLQRPPSATLLEAFADPDPFPAWLSPADLTYFVANFEASGFRGPINRYRNIDLLMIDDIQFIAGKEKTQEEFFHTFNSIYESHKQIVISSDKVPRDIPDLEERLRSRFEWGLIADIQSPDLETKVAILKKKADQNNINLPDDVALFIASSIKSNIRELEGSLIRVGAYSSLSAREITADFAREILKDTLASFDHSITVDEVKKEVAVFFQLKVSDLNSKRRTQNLVFPRQIAMYLCRQLTDASLPVIGKSFGGRDHSTVIHSVNLIEQKKKTQENTRHSDKSVIIGGEDSSYEEGDYPRDHLAGDPC